METTDLQHFPEIIEKYVDIIRDRLPCRGKGAFTSVDLLSVARDSGEITNSEILDELAKIGFRFTDLTEGEIIEIEKAFLEEYEKRMRLVMLNFAKGEELGETQESISGAILKAAMERYSEIVLSHIEQGVGVSRDLSEPYKIFKQRKYGFTYPIGKATGQLAANLTRGKVRLRRT